jgi:hypothetical protein
MGVRSVDRHRGAWEAYEKEDDFLMSTEELAVYDFAKFEKEENLFTRKYRGHHYWNLLRFTMANDLFIFPINTMRMEGV